MKLELLNSYLTPPFSTVFENNSKILIYNFEKKSSIWMGICAAKQTFLFCVIIKQKSISLTIFYSATKIALKINSLADFLLLIFEHCTFFH